MMNYLPWRSGRSSKTQSPPPIIPAQRLVTPPRRPSVLHDRGRPSMHSTHSVSGQSIASIASRPELGVFYQIAQLTDYLFVSGARAVQFSRLADRGITCIVNATIELPNLPIPQIDYLKIPVGDTTYANLYPFFDVVADKIFEVRKRGGKTLVHCIAGVSRSVSLCLAYLMKYEGMSLRKAYLYVKSRRSIAHPNVGFFRQLIEYERRLFGYESVRMIHTQAVGPIPDVYEDEYRNLMWNAKYNQYNNTDYVANF